MKTITTSTITRYALPSAESISRRSFKKIALALATTKNAEAGLRIEAVRPRSAAYQGNILTPAEAKGLRNLEEGLRLLSNKLGIFEVVLKDPVFGRDEKMLVLDCLRAMSTNGTGRLLQVTEALIELARDAGLIEPRDRMGRDTFTLR